MQQIYRRAPMPKCDFNSFFGLRQFFIDHWNMSVSQKVVKQKIAGKIFNILPWLRKLEINENHWTD